MPANVLKRCLIFILLSILYLPSIGQTDTVRLKAHHYLYVGDKITYAAKDTFVVLPECTPYKIRKDISAFFVNRFKGRALALFYRPESETTPVIDTVLHVKGENPYMKYQGKIIREINIQTLDVSGAKNIPAKFKLKRFADSIVDGVHVTTKHRVIRNNLLFDVGDTVNAYLLGDNEKNLRDLSFIQDARIYIDTATAHGDSVDVYVVTKDLWTMGIILTTNPGDWYRISLFDANFLGYGQRLQLFSIHKDERFPHWGYGAAYSKNNIRGSFIDLSMGYSNMNGGPRVGPEDEESYYVRVSKPYLLPTNHFIWGVESSFNRSINITKRPPLEFRDYTSAYADIWAAYSVSRERTEERRLRKGEGIFLAVHFQRKYFIKRPWQEAEQFSVALNNQWFTVASLTFFRQRFYKTRYVTGFGKTEDVPYGHKLVFYTGFQYMLFYPRYYAAIEASKEIALSSGSFGFARVYAGGFLERNHPKDLLILTRAYWYTRVFHAGLVKMRQKFFCSYAIVKFPEFANWATINAGSGINGFRSALVYGRQRFVVGTETTSWFPFPLLGFRIQSFMSLQAAMVGMDRDYIFDNRMYGGAGVGVRIKNENLVFKTLELRAYYYPNAPKDIPMVVFDMSLYFELKFAQSPVHSPGFIAFD
jgi:hypothetical protein